MAVKTPKKPETNGSTNRRELPEGPLLTAATAINYGTFFEQTDDSTLIGFRLVGLRPGLLMHSGEAQRMNEEAAEKHKARSGGKRASKFVPLPEQEAEWGAYRMPGTGELYLPFENVLRMLTVAGVKFQDPNAPRYSLKEVMAGAVTAPLGCEIGYVLLGPDSEEPLTEYALDRRRVGLGRNGSVMRARPRIDEWICDVSLELDESALTLDVFCNVLRYAVKRVGLMDYRPAKSGPFGRSRVERFEVIS